MTFSIERLTKLSPREVTECISSAITNAIERVKPGAKICVIESDFENKWITNKQKRQIGFIA